MVFNQFANHHRRRQLVRCQSALRLQLEVKALEIEHDLEDLHVVGQRRVVNQPVAILVELVDANELFLVTHQAVKLG